MAPSTLAPPPAPDALVDPARLRAVRAAERVLTPTNDVLDGLAATARQLLGTPLGLVTLVDDARQHMPGAAFAHGVADPGRTVDLSRSVCRFVVASGRPLAIDDTRTHPWTADTGVAQSSGVVSYLGLPIPDEDGRLLGALCVVGSQPRRWSDDDHARLAPLAAAARAEVLRAMQLERYRVAIEATGEVVYALDVGSGFVWREGAVEALYGPGAAQVAAEPGGWLRLMHPDDALRVGPAWMAAIERGATAWEGEYRLRHADGRIVTVRDTAQLQRDANGALRRIVGRVADVSREQSALAELRESELRLRAVLDTMRDGVVVQDAEDHITLSNPAACRILGLTEDQLRGRSSYDPQWRAMRPDGTPFDPAAHPSVVAMRTRQPQTDVAMRVARPDGTEVWLSIDSEPMVLPGSPAPTAALTTFRDVTREREAMRASAFLAAIVSSSNLPIVSTSLDGVIRSWNRAAEVLFGRAAADMVGRPYAESIPAEHATRERDALAAATQGHVQELETARLRADGVSVPVRVTISPVVSDEAGRLGLAMVFRDLTQIRLLEAELQQVQKLEAMGRLAGGVAHDFNNLLTAIRGNAELLRAEMPPIPALLDDVDEILRTVSRATRLTRQLLAFSRKQVVQPRALHLNEVVRGAVTMLSRLVSVDTRIELVEGEGDPIVRMDAGQLDQILVNLAVNAADAMPEGGTLRVTVATASAGERPAGAPAVDVFAAPHARLTVTDTGVGMDEGTRRRAFEPFFTTKPEGRGTGLGLSMVYGIARQSGGVAWITSAPGAGTTVAIALPLETRPAPDDAPGEAATELARPERRAASAGTVLVVDDTPSVLEATARLLEQAGFRVLRATAPSGALARLGEASAEGRPVDVVVTDLMMPEGGGASLIAQLRALRPSTRILVVSGHPGNVAQPTFDDGRTRFLAKPFGGRDLVAAVRALIG